ncbi:MAG TPA: flagellin [Bryobacteraceae bacterium]|nr:flagellin [Bryobacteraceae bacterium]
MSFSINTNIASLQAMNYLTANQQFQNKTINEVTSGLRIVNSGDDAAGLAVANQYASDEAVLTQGIQNANDGLATLQTIDGGMSNISQLLNRASTLATESATGTFQGSREVLNNEFQSVLGEINRQAQSIGMNSGGAFAKSLSVFIGGGRDAAGNQNNQAAVNNGSVTVDLSNSAVDTQSLGLSSYSTTANAGTDLATITAGTTAGNVDLTFYGAGYAAGVTVTAQGVDNASSLSDVVNDINSAISTAANTAGAANTAFADQNIQAQLNSSGTGIVFTSANGAFSVTDGPTNGKAAAENILGETADAQAVFANGTQQLTLDYGTAIGGADTQDLTFTATDASGNVKQTEVTLSADTKADQITAINNALQSAGGPLANLVAVDADGSATGNITLIGTNSFNVAVGTTTTPGDGFTTSADTQGVIADSALVGNSGGLDISNASDAGLAVTAIGNAVANLGTAQAVVGKGENTLTYATNLAQSELTNEATSESGIRDANMATEAANLTKAQILLQAGVAALAQANAAPQNILTLLKS